MQTELAFELDEQIVQQARRYAMRHGKTVAQLVADYLAKLSETESSSLPQELPPITKSLRGILRDRRFAEQDYHDYLAEKYL